MCAGTLCFDVIFIGGGGGNSCDFQVISLDKGALPKWGLPSRGHFESDTTGKGNSSESAFILKGK